MLGSPIMYPVVDYTLFRRTLFRNKVKNLFCHKKCFTIVQRDEEGNKSEFNNPTPKRELLERIYGKGYK